MNDFSPYYASQLVSGEKLTPLYEEDNITGYKFTRIPIEGTIVGKIKIDDKIHTFVPDTKSTGEDEAIMYDYKIDCKSGALVVHWIKIPEEFIIDYEYDPYQANEINNIDNINLNEIGEDEIKNPINSDYLTKEEYAKIYFRIKVKNWMDKRYEHLNDLCGGVVWTTMIDFLTFTGSNEEEIELIMGKYRKRKR